MSSDKRLFALLRRLAAGLPCELCDRPAGFPASTLRILDEYGWVVLQISHREGGWPPRWVPAVTPLVVAVTSPWAAPATRNQL